MDVSQAIDAFFQDNRAFSEATISSYKFSIRKFFEFCGKDLLHVQRQDIKDWQTYFLNEGKRPNTVNLRLSALKSFYLYLVEEGIVTQNPTLQISKPKVERQLANSFPPTVLFKLREVTKESPRDRAVLETLYSTGVRVSELTDMKLQDIYWDLNSVIIIRAKNKRQRFVFFTHETRHWLQRYLNSRNDDSPYLFVNHHQNKLTRQGIFILVKKWLKQAHLEFVISPHSFRHTFATRMLEKGARMEDLSELLGHRNQQSTRIYASYGDKARKRIYDEYF